MVKPFKESFDLVGTNLHIFDYPGPSHLGIHNEVITNKVFNLRFMPLFLVEHPIIAFNPNRPKHDVVNEVPNL